jgi:UDP-N-acetylmuramoylalanine--D-glutamate ligase
VKLPRRALVLGLARSGQAAALALARHGVPTLAVDKAEGLDVGRLAEAGVEVQLGTEEDRLLDGVDLLVKSPGVPGESPLPSAARERGVPVWSEIELGSASPGRTARRPRASCSARSSAPRSARLRSRATSAAR